MATSENKVNSHILTFVGYAHNQPVQKSPMQYILFYYLSLRMHICRLVNLPTLVGVNFMQKLAILF